MRIINNSSKKSPWRRFPTAGSVALLLLLLGLLAFLLSAAGLSVAESNQDTFPSAEKATAALFGAVQANSDDAAVQYARTLIDADVVGSGGRPANQQQSSEPLHGYYFGKLKNGKARTESFIVVAYPAEYRSSGVMTFVVAATGVVYEK